MYSNGHTPLEVFTGKTPDISECLDFGSYYWEMFRSIEGMGLVYLVRWIIFSYWVDTLMSYRVFPESGTPISCTTVYQLTYVDTKIVCLIITRKHSTG